MSAPILRPVGELRPIWSPADARQLAADAAKHPTERGQHRLRDWVWAPLLVFCGIVFPGLAAPPAHANPVTDAVVQYGIPVVCGTLDVYPSADGVTGVLVALIDDGYTPPQAFDVIVKSVLAFCNEHAPAVDAFVDRYAQPGQRA
jgi:hypothetical protein